MTEAEKLKHAYVDMIRRRVDRVAMFVPYGWLSVRMSKRDGRITGARIVATAPRGYRV